MVYESKKMNGGKLLAAVAIFAMVVCVFAVAAPATDAKTVDTDVTGVNLYSTGGIDASSAEQKYYVSSENEVNITVTGNNAVALYIANGTTVNVISAEATVTAYVVVPGTWELNSGSNTMGKLKNDNAVAVSVKTTTTSAVGIKATYATETVNGAQSVSATLDVSGTVAADITSATASSTDTVGAVNITLSGDVELTGASETLGISNTTTTYSGNVTAVISNADIGITTSGIVNIPGGLAISVEEESATDAAGKKVTITGTSGFSGTISYSGMYITGTGMSNNFTVTVADGTTTPASLTIGALTTGTYSDASGVTFATGTRTEIVVPENGSLDVSGISSMLSGITRVNSSATGATFTGTISHINSTTNVNERSFSASEFSGDVIVSSGVINSNKAGQLFLLDGNFVTLVGVPNGTELYVGADAKLGLRGNLTVNGTMNLGGSIISVTSSANGDSMTTDLATATDAAMRYVIVAKDASNGTGTLNAMLGAALKHVYIVGDGNKNISDAMEPVYIRDGNLNSEGEYSQFQIVVIENNLNITGLKDVKILGELTVNSGVTVTVADESSLQIGMKDGNYTVVADVDIQGTVNVSGDLIINSKDVTVSNGGAVNVNRTGTLNVASGDLTIGTGSSLSISGTLTTAGTLKNSGTVTFDEGTVADGTTTIALTSQSGAVVDISSIKLVNGKTLTVTAGTDTAVSSFSITAASTTTDTSIIDVKVTERYEDKVSSVVVSGSPAIDGTVPETVAVDTAPATISVSKAYIGDMDLSEGIKLDVAAGENIVEGEMTVDQNAFIIGKGDLTVEGQIVSDKKLAIDSTGVTGIAKLNAAYYRTTTPTVHYYVSFDGVLTSGADRVTIYGDVAATTDGTVPANMIITGDENGSVSINVDEGVTLTIDEGAKVRDCGTINVEGTLVVENNNDVTGTKIVADVSKAVGNGTEYTNLVLALANADEGETVTIYRSPETAVIIDSDMEIPAGVTLKVDNGKRVQVSDDVTVTVNGTLFVSAGSFDAETAFAEETSEDASKLIVNGLYQSLSERPFDADTFNVPGAYYHVGQYYCIEPVANAVADINTYVDDTVAVYGDNEAGDFTVTGEADVGAYVIVYGTLDAGTITMDNACFCVEDTGAFTGTVGSAVGAMDLVNVKRIILVDDTVTGADDAKTDYLYVIGTPVKADESANAPAAKANVASGVVTVGTETAYEYNASNVASAIDAGATLSVLGKYTDDETTVLGTLAVAVADTEKKTSAGDARIGKLIVGANPYAASTGADATVTGSVSVSALNVAEIYAGATFTQELPSSFKSTAYYIEDSLWLTVYAKTTAANVPLINAYKPAELTNSVFKTWAYDNAGTMTTIPANDSTMKVGDHAEVYAEINYDIYAVVVTADNGIGSVYIDGEAMVKYSNLFYAIGLDAGEHTITWETKNGFTGTVTMTVNGTAVTSGTINFEGNELEALPGLLEGVVGVNDSNNQYVVYEVTLNGTTAVTGGETSSDDGGMGLTDYLLIILVVLIVVMAIMVALRLMRS